MVDIKFCASLVGIYKTMSAQHLLLVLLHPLVTPLLVIVQLVSHAQMVPGLSKAQLSAESAHQVTNAQLQLFQQASAVPRPIAMVT